MADVDTHDADNLPSGSDANDSNNTAPNNPTPAEPNASEPTTFEVAGEQVSLDDLKAGYLRQSDYTRKTQKLAEDQKKYEAMLENLKGQSSNTADDPKPAGESPTVPANLEEALVRFTKWEQSQKAADRVAEWDSFKSSNGLELTDDEEAAFVQERNRRAPTSSTARRRERSHGDRSNPPDLPGWQPASHSIRRACPGPEHALEVHPIAAARGSRGHLPGYRFPDDVKPGAWRGDPVPRDRFRRS